MANSKNMKALLESIAAENELTATVSERCLNTIACLVPLRVVIDSGKRGEIGALKAECIDGGMTKEQARAYFPIAGKFADCPEVAGVRKAKDARAFFADNGLTTVDSVSVWFKENTEAGREAEAKRQAKADAREKEAEKEAVKSDAEAKANAALSALTPAERIAHFIMIEVSGDESEALNLAQIVARGFAAKLKAAA